MARWGEAVLSRLTSLCLAPSFRASFFFFRSARQTIRKTGTSHSQNLQPMFNWFSFTNKGKHMPGQSMLVLYPASLIVSQCLFMEKRFHGTHPCLSPHAGNPSFETCYSFRIPVASTPPCLRDSSPRNPSPCPKTSLTRSVV